MASSISNDPPALVVGGDGLVGQALAETLRHAGLPVLVTTRRPDRSGSDRPLLDLAALDADALDRVAAAAGGTAYLCAAVARLNDCRRDPVGAARVNIDGMLTLARRLVAQGTHVLFFSTNQVFNGARPLMMPEDPVSPVTEYGRQKAAAEAEILSLAGNGARVSILRLTKVIGTEMALFRDWRAALRQGQPIFPFHDMAVAPIGIDTVIAAARAVGEGGDGIFHLSASRDVSYADLAYHVARIWAVPNTLIRPVSHTDTGTLLEKPALHTVLDCRRLTERFAIRSPDPFAAIDRYHAREGRSGL